MIVQIETDNLAFLKVFVKKSNNTVKSCSEDIDKEIISKANSINSNKNTFSCDWGGHLELDDI